MKRIARNSGRSNVRSDVKQKHSLRKRVASTVAAAGVVVAIQVAPGCVVYYVMPVDHQDASSSDGAVADSATDHPIYYVMAQDAGPPRDAPPPRDAAADHPVYYVMAWDAGHAPDSNVAQDHPVYYIMAQDGGLALDVNIHQDHPIYYIMAWDAGHPADAGAVDHKQNDADLQDQPIYYIMAMDY